MPENPLTRKLGPLPVWQWALILTGGVFIYRAVRGRNGPGAGDAALYGPVSAEGDVLYPTASGFGQAGIMPASNVPPVPSSAMLSIPSYYGALGLEGSGQDILSILAALQGANLPLSSPPPSTYTEPAPVYYPAPQPAASPPTYYTQPIYTAPAPAPSSGFYCGTPRGADWCARYVSAAECNTFATGCVPCGASGVPTC